MPKRSPETGSDTQFALDVLEIIGNLLDQFNDREEALHSQVNYWISQAKDKSLSKAARVTYHECAGDAISCMQWGKGELWSTPIRPAMH
jgi:hypothetical protein